MYCSEATFSMEIIEEIAKARELEILNPDKRNTSKLVGYKKEADEWFLKKKKKICDGCCIKFVFNHYGY